MTPTNPMRGLLMATLLSLAMPGFAQPPAPGQGGADGVPLVVPNTSVRTMQASGSGRGYQITVALPSRPPRQAGYPVIYVLDANIMLMTAIDAARAYDRRLDRQAGDDAVVVGIGYPEGVDAGAERMYDMTPPGSGDSRIKRPTGGADAFLDFIEHDLKPAVAAAAKVDPGRQAIFGHSLGGQFVLYTMITRPQLFDTYLAASPSMWFSDTYLLKRLPEVAKAWSPGQQPKRLLLTVGAYEQELHPALRHHPRAQEFADRFAGMHQTEYVRKAAGMLEDIPGVLFEFQEIAAEDHGSVIPASIGRAVFFDLTGPKIPPVPDAQAYVEMVAQQRYDLRLQVRDLPDSVRIPWLNQFKKILHEGLTRAQLESLHEERNRMDKANGTKPHAVNADP